MPESWSRPRSHLSSQTVVAGIALASAAHHRTDAVLSLGGSFAAAASASCIQLSSARVPGRCGGSYFLNR